MQSSLSTSDSVHKTGPALCDDIIYYMGPFLQHDRATLKDFACADRTCRRAAKRYLLAHVVLTTKDTAAKFCDWVENNVMERKWIEKLKLVVPKDAKAEWLPPSMKRLGAVLSTLRQLLIVLAPEGSEDVSVFRPHQIAGIVKALDNFSSLIQLRLEGLPLSRDPFASTLCGLPSLKLLDLVQCRFHFEGALHPQTIPPIPEFRYIECLDSRDMFMTWFGASCDPHKLRSVTLRVNYRESMGSINQFLHSLGPHLKHLDLKSRHVDEPYSFQLLHEINLDQNIGLESLKLNRIEDIILLNLTAQFTTKSLHTLILVTPHSSLENLSELDSHFAQAGYDRLRSIRFEYDGPLDESEVLAQIRSALPSIQASVISVDKVDKIAPPLETKLHRSLCGKLFIWAKRVLRAALEHFHRW